MQAMSACYHSVQNLLPSRLLSKNIKIRIYRIILLSVVLHGCETWCLTSAQSAIPVREQSKMASQDHEAAAYSPLLTVNCKMYELHHRNS
jgi:hypothetical protein